MISQRSSFWEYLDAYPPPYCRLLGKNPGSGTADLAVTDAETAIRSEIPVSRIRQISQMENWHEVSTGELRRIFAAINFDPTNAHDRKRVATYEIQCTKRNTVPFHYLRRNPKWATEFLPLLVIANRIMKSRGALLPTSVTLANSA